MINSPEAGLVMFGMRTGSREGGATPRLVDLRPRILTADDSQESRALYTHPLPQGRILITPRLPANLPEGFDAAISMPRGYQSPIVLEHRTEDVRGFKVWRQVPSLTELIDADGFVHSLHKINPDGSAALLGVGFSPKKARYDVYTFDEVIISKKADRQLIMTLWI